GVAGDLLDRIAAVAQDARFAVDEGDRALAGAGVAIAGIERNRAAVGAELLNIDADLTLGADDDRQLVLFPVERELRRARRRHGHRGFFDQSFRFLRHPQILPSTSRALRTCGAPARILSPGFANAQGNRRRSL